MDRHPARLRGSTQPEVRPQVARRAIAVRGAHFIVQGAAGHLDLDARADAVPVALPALEAKLQPVPTWAAVIHKKGCRPLVRNEQDIQIAVVVEISKRSAAPDVR